MSDDDNLFQQTNGDDDNEPKEQGSTQSEYNPFLNPSQVPPSEPEPIEPRERPSANATPSQPPEGDNPAASGLEEDAQGNSNPPIQDDPEMGQADDEPIAEVVEQEPAEIVAGETSENQLHDEPIAEVVDPQLEDEVSGEEEVEPEVGDETVPQADVGDDEDEPEGADEKVAQADIEDDDGDSEQTDETDDGDDEGGDESADPGEEDPTLSPPVEAEEEENVQEATERVAQGAIPEELEEFLNQAESNASDRRDQQRERNWIEFSFVKNETIEKIKAVFTPYKQFDDMIDDLEGDSFEQERNIYFILGERHTGRYATALRLALALNDFEHETLTMNIRQYIPDNTTKSLSIEDIINRINQQTNLTEVEDEQDEAFIPPNAIIIVRNAFQDAPDKRDLRELREEYTEQFRYLLGDVRLILTADISADDNIEINQFPHIRTQNAQGSLAVNINDVFDKHLDFHMGDDGLDLFQDLLNTLNQLKDQILEMELLPIDVDLFIRNVLKREPESNEEVLKIAEEIVGRRTQRANRKWFESFDYFNQKLYVMFAVMFEGLNRYQLDDLYDEAVTHLRQEADKYYEDPRYISVQSMLDDIHMEEKDSETLEFIQNQQAYYRIVREQMREYYRLLWGLVDVFVNKIKVSPANRDRRLRRLLASNIGQIGVYRQTQLQQILKEMVDDAPHVAEAATHALIEIASNVDHHHFVVKILRDWINTMQVLYRVSAMGAIAGVYQKITELYLTNETQINEADETNEVRIAKETINELRKLIVQYCGAVHSVDQDRSYRESSRILESQRNKMEKDIQQAILGGNRSFRARWEKSNRFKNELSKDIRKQVSQQINRLLLSTEVKLSDQLKLAAVDRLVEIAQNFAEPIIELLREWLNESPDSGQWEIARMVINDLFSSTQDNKQNVMRSEQLKLFVLLPDILAASENVVTNVGQFFISGTLVDEIKVVGGDRNRRRIIELVRQSPVGQVLATTDHWYGMLMETKPSDIDLWYEHVFLPLLNMVNQASESLRHVFIRSLLNIWFKSAYDEVVSSATTLLKRTLILNGYVLDLPTSHYGILMLDASELRSQIGDYYLDFAFEVSQRIAVFAPIQVHDLGRIQRDKPIYIGRLNLENERIDTSTSAELLSRTMGHPSLIMPGLESMSGHRLSEFVNDCLYVLVLNLNPVLDWGDIIDEASDLYESVQTANMEFNPFTDDEKPPALDEIHWQWHGKFVINRLDDNAFIPEILPSGIITTYTALPSQFTDYTFVDKLIENIQNDVQDRIIMNLHQITPEEMLSDLNAYCQWGQQSAQDLEFTDYDKLFDQLDTWLGILADTANLPGTQDTATFVNWAVLLLARVDLNSIVDLIIDWLDRENFDDEDNEDNSTNIYNLIGVASTKQLFLFYGSSYSGANPDEHSDLLRLLPAFMQHQPNYLEYVWIFRTLLRWAKDSAWSERLVNNPNGSPEILEALKAIEDPDDIERLLEVVQFYEASLRIQDLFVDMNVSNKINSLNEYIKIINALIYKNEVIRQNATQYGGRRSRRRRRQRNQPRQPSPEQQLDEILAPINQQEEQQLLELRGLNQANQSQIVGDLYRVERDLHQDPSYAMHHPNQTLNQKAVLDSMRLQLFSPTSQVLRLPDDKLYGVILFGINTQNVSRPKFEVNFALDESSRFIVNFLNALIDHEEGHTIVPVVHRLGRHDVIYTHTASHQRKKRVSLKSETIVNANLQQNTIPIMGPILERYSPENVGFVIIITDKTIIDFDDWVLDEDNDWVSRMNLYPLSHRVNDHGISVITTTQSSDRNAVPVMESICNRIMSRIKRST